MTEEEAVENIDIGGPTMIRAAAKNHRSVAVLVRPESYDAVLAELEASEGSISEETRHWLANEAWAEIARYDAAISRWFGLRYEAFPQHWVFAYEKFLDLSYGENPHQKAALYVESGARSHVLARMAKLHGRSLSFNNVLDLDAATKLLAEFEEPAAVIVKHNNPCGAAIADDIAAAYEKALACDPLSAFGGVIALNRPVDKVLAERLHENFIEVLIAPEYSEDALEVLMQKEAIRILHNTEDRGLEPRERDMKRVRGGLLLQTPDLIEEERDTMEVATTAQPSEEAWRDLEFSWARVQARALERDRDREGRSDARHRSGADEPGGLGADRDRQGARGEGGRRGRLPGRLGRGLGRVLPLPGRSADRDRCRLHRDHPAGRVEARPRGGRGVRRGGRRDGDDAAPPLPPLGSATGCHTGFSGSCTWSSRLG